MPGIFGCTENWKHVIWDINSIKSGLILSSQLLEVEKAETAFPPNVFPDFHIWVYSRNNYHFCNYIILKLLAMCEVHPSATLLTGLALILFFIWQFGTFTNTVKWIFEVVHYREDIWSLKYLLHCFMCGSWERSWIQSNEYLKFCIVELKTF